MAQPATIDGEPVETLVAGFSGMLLRPGDDGYEEARHVHNALVDKRPALIARCGGTADVVDAIGFARDSGLEISVRGGGHNVAGKAVNDGGVMVDLSLMKGIHVDPAARTVRAQGVSPGASSTGRQPFMASPPPVESSRPPASPGSRSAEGSAGWPEPAASRSTTSSRWSS